MIVVYNNNVIVFLVILIFIKEVRMEKFLVVIDKFLEYYF